MKLELSPLSKAVTRLEEGLVRYRSDTTDLQIRDGLIQRFEFTYELAHRALKRYLEGVSPNPAEYDAADFQFLIRSASEQGLILHGWPDWRRYREMRTKTSHTYNEETALDVVAGIPAFLDEARHLCRELQSRTDR